MQTLSTEIFYREVLQKFQKRLQLKPWVQSPQYKDIPTKIAESMKNKLQRNKQLYQICRNKPTEIQREMREYLALKEAKEASKKKPSPLRCLPQEEDDLSKFHQKNNQDQIYQPRPLFTQPLIEEAESGDIVDVSSECENNVNSFGSNASISVTASYQSNTRLSNAKTLRIKLHNVFIKAPKLKAELILKEAELIMIRKN